MLVLDILASRSFVSQSEKIFVVISLSTFPEPKSSHVGCDGDFGIEPKMFELATDLEPKLLSSDRALEKKKRSLFEEENRSGGKKKKRRRKIVQDLDLSSGGGKIESHPECSTDFSPKVLKVPPLKIIFSNGGAEDGSHVDHEAVVVAGPRLADDGSLEDHDQTFKLHCESQSLFLRPKTSY